MFCLAFFIIPPCLYAARITYTSYFPPRLRMIAGDALCDCRHPSIAVEMRSTPFCHIKQRSSILICRNFGTTYRSQFLEDGTDMLSRNVRNYQSAKRNNAKRRRSQTKRCTFAVLCHIRLNYRMK
jgi:hypothetical protein